MTKEARVIKVSLPGMTIQMGVARREAARLWNRMVKLHHWGRKRNIWFSESQFKVHFKGRFALHSQTAQGLIEKFFSNIDSTRTQRNQGDKTARYPWKSRKKFQAIIWKGQSIKAVSRHLVLPMGKGRKPLLIHIPENLPPGKIAQVELGYYELRITLTRDAQYPEQRQGIASIDPGVIVLGNIGDLNRGKKKRSSKRNNQANGNNPFGQFRQYLGYKLKRSGRPWCFKTSTTRPKPARLAVIDTSRRGASSAVVADSKRLGISLVNPTS